MANITSTVNLNNTAYRQASSGGNPFFNNNQTYSVPEAPVSGYNPLRKPTTSASLPTRPVAPVGVNMPIQPTTTPKTYDSGAAFHAIDSGVQAITPGDGGVGDATVEQGRQKLIADMKTIHNAEDKDTAIADVQADPFYKSATYWDGILRGALKAYDGGSASDIFDATNTGFAQGKQEEEQNQVKLNAQANTQDLLQHYTPDSVANYQATGNPQYLRERKLTIEQQQAQDEATEDRRDTRQQAQFEQQNKLAEQRQIAAEQRANQHQDQLNATADEKQSKNIVTQYAKDKGKTVSQNQKSLMLFGNATRNLDDADEARKSGDYALAGRKLYDAAEESAKAKKGGNASVSLDEVQEELHIGGTFQNKEDLIRSIAGKSVSNDTFNTYKKAVHQSHDNEMNNIQEQGLQDVYNYEDQLGEDKAIEMVNRHFVGAGGFGKVTKEQYRAWKKKQDGDEDEQSSNVPNNAALSSNNTGATTTPNFSPTDFLNQFNKKK
ncbi:hypothetical protein P9477_23240 [Enterobacter mori]|uniref:hypothetical protein n=1 Tax=Enterobacter mori TaxID=539813 RepID=UPI00398A7BA8